MKGFKREQARHDNMSPPEDREVPEVICCECDGSRLSEEGYALAQKQAARRFDPEQEKRRYEIEVEYAADLLIAADEELEEPRYRCDACDGEGGHEWEDEPPEPDDDFEVCGRFYDGT